MEGSRGAGGAGGGKPGGGRPGGGPGGAGPRGPGGGPSGEGLAGLGGFDLGAIVRQAQRMQDELGRIQEEVAARTVEASAGAGMVTAVANGRRELVALRIDPQAVDPRDVKMLEDLVLAAVNQALNRAQELVAEEMSKVTGGLRLPGLF